MRAPAKLNLYLRVLGRRPDGYHELETLFERIDLADELAFEPAARELSLTGDDPTLSSGPENLVLRAARALRQATRTSRGARIHLTKRIPIAAGLGGGSSDAAAALLGLNELWRLGLGQAELVRLAGELGADVPFFLSEATFAVGRGRGDRCEPVACVRSLAHVLVVPGERLSTKEIYEASQFDLTAPKPSITMVVHALRNGSLSELADGLWNDLEPEAIRRCPPSALILSHLRDLGCLGTRLSGSGPSVFGLCRDAPHAQEVAARLHGLVLGRSVAGPTWRVEIVQTESPSLVVTPSVR